VVFVDRIVVDRVLPSSGLQPGPVFLHPVRPDPEFIFRQQIRNALLNLCSHLSVLIYVLICRFRVRICVPFACLVLLVSATVLARARRNSSVTSPSGDSITNPHISLEISLPAEARRFSMLGFKRFGTATISISGIELRENSVTAVQHWKFAGQTCNCSDVWAVILAA
jgi:hypothetical protein